jgi:hypothetical protein
VSGRYRAPGLVALAALWGATDVAYSIYLLASEPAGVVRTMMHWLPHARQTLHISAVLGIIIGGALFVGAFMTRYGARRGLVVLFGAVVLYILSGIAYALWGLITHEEASVAIYTANRDYGNEINDAIWGYFVAVGCTSLIVGAALLFAIRRAWRRYPEGEDLGSVASAVPSALALPTRSVPTSIADEIERLDGLRDRGLITNEEYQQAKGKLLA